MNAQEKLNFKDDEIYKDNTITIHSHIESPLAYDLGMLLEDDVKEEMYELLTAVTLSLDD
jgi:hypothetical protein